MTLVSFVRHCPWVCHALTRVLLPGNQTLHVQPRAQSAPVRRRTTSRHNEYRLNTMTSPKSSSSYKVHFETPFFERSIKLLLVKLGTAQEMALRSLHTVVLAPLLGDSLYAALQLRSCSPSRATALKPITLPNRVATVLRRTCFSAMSKTSTTSAHKRSNEIK